MKNFGRKVLISVLAFCMIASTVIISAKPYHMLAETKQETKKSALKAYKKVLRKSNIVIAGDTYDASRDMFFVVDIDHNEIPELVMRGIGGQTIYSYKNNSIKRVESFTAAHMLQSFEKGNILRTGWMLHGYLYEAIYKLSKGKLKLVASATCNYDQSENPKDKFIIKGKKTTKKKYDSYVKKLSRNSRYNDIECYRISSDNIEKYVK